MPRPWLTGPGPKRHICHAWHPLDHLKGVCSTSQCADEIAAAAWPDLPISVQQWDPAAGVWRDLGPWDAGAWDTEIVLGDPLPLIAVHTLCKWIVPITDGAVWWWTPVAQRPQAVPLAPSVPRRRSRRFPAPGDDPTGAVGG